MNIEIFKDVSVVIAVIGGIVLFPPNIYLSIVLRKHKTWMVEEIISGVPNKLQDRIRFGIESNMSWVFASLGLYIWFTWLMFRYGWHVTPSEFQRWHCAIKRAYGRHIGWAYLSVIGANVFSVGMFFFILLFFISK